MKGQLQNFLKGIIKENPTFVMMLGMCPTLAVTKTVESAIGMGMCILFVLFFSNLIISCLKNIIPNEIRIPVYIVIIASLVTIVEMVLNAFLPALYSQLGVFVSLIVVNCIILGRAEAFASKNDPVSSMVDAVGMAIGVTLALVVIAFVREFVGNGTITIWGDLVIDCTGLYSVLHLEPVGLLQTNAGAFLTLGLLVGCINAISNNASEKKAAKAKAEALKAKEAAKLAAEGGKN